MKQQQSRSVELWSGGKFTNRLSRLRHFRGHGVHSPFVYSIVRDVYMKDCTAYAKSYLTQSLLELEVKGEHALEIAATADHCNLGSYSVDKIGDCKLVICSEQCPNEDLISLCNKAQQCGTAIVIISPYKRRALCNELLKTNSSSSIDRLGYLFFFNNHLPKQLFKL